MNKDQVDAINRAAYPGLIKTEREVYYRRPFLPYLDSTLIKRAEEKLTASHGQDFVNSITEWEVIK